MNKPTHTSHHPAISFCWHGLVNCELWLLLGELSSKGCVSRSVKLHTLWVSYVVRMYSKSHSFQKGILPLKGQEMAVMISIFFPNNLTLWNVENIASVVVSLVRGKDNSSLSWKKQLGNCSITNWTITAGKKSWVHSVVRRYFLVLWGDECMHGMMELYFRRQVCWKIQRNGVRSSRLLSGVWHLEYATVRGVMIRSGGFFLCWWSDLS